MEERGGRGRVLGPSETGGGARGGALRELLQVCEVRVGEEVRGGGGRWREGGG